MSEMTPSMEEVLALLKTFMERQRSEYGLISLGVFGPFARGEARSDSDVDIVFETN
jgi:predicted nucleotidyltransferase